MKVVLFNAQSVGSSKKRSEISCYVEDNDIDFLFIVETWLHHEGDEAKCFDLCPLNHKIESFPRSSRGGVLALLYKTKYAHFLTFDKSFPFAHSSFEMFKVSYVFRRTYINFFCIYRPPSKNCSESIFFEEFCDFLSYCNTCNGGLCILGDFNFHIDAPQNFNTRKFMHLLDMHGLVQLTSAPTHRGGHILDLVIVRADEHYHLSTSVSNALQSDHLRVASYFRMNFPEFHSVKYINKRNLSGIDNKQFRTDIVSAFSRLSTSSSNDYDAILKNILDEHAPIQRIRLPIRKTTPWFHAFSADISKAKRDRQRAERCWRASGNPVDRELYKRARREVTELIH